MEWVSFVGSGPGDPDLLTLRAVDLIRAADVVVTEVPGHAQLVRTSSACPRRSPMRTGRGRARRAGRPELVDGGFGDDGPPLTNAARAKMVVSPAKTGQRVVRLMSGDPFVHASGPEEAQAVVKAGIGFEVVPGVSAATAVPAYAGIPLTTKDHREFAVVGLQRHQGRLGVVRRPRHAGAALRAPAHRRHRRRADRGRPGAGHPGRR